MNWKRAIRVGWPWAGLGRGDGALLGALRFGTGQGRGPNYLAQAMRSCRAFLLFILVLSQSAWAWVDNDDQPVDDATSDLTQVGLWKGFDGSLIFELRTRGKVVSDRIRIFLFDREPSTENARQEALWMVERNRLYSRATEIRGWAWNEVDAIVSVAASNVWIARLPSGIAPARGAWLVETMGPNEVIVDRTPNVGAASYIIEELPTWSAPTRSASVNMAQLYEDAPVALSLRYETDVKAVRWERMADVPPVAWTLGPTDSLPIYVYLRDMTRGVQSECVFTSAYSGAEWLRWEGEALGMACSLRISSNKTGGGQFDMFLHSDTDRLMEVTIALGIGGHGWSWWGEQGRVECRQKSKADQSADAEQESRFYPFGVLANDDRLCYLALSPQEPRPFRFFADSSHEGARLAMSAMFTLTSYTTNLPRRASLSLIFDSVPRSLPNAFLEAVAILHERGILSQSRGFEARINLSDWPKLRGFYALPAVARSVRSVDEARAALELATGLPGDTGEEALVSRIGAIRDAREAPIFRFQPADAAVAYADWWLDPDARTTATHPLSPAMYLWRKIEPILSDRRAEGFILALPDPVVPQYDGAALGVADHPCEYDGKAERPFLRNGVGAVEFLQMVCPKVRAAKKMLALELTGALDPFSMYFGEAFVLPSAPDYTESELAKWMERLRVIAGVRPILAEPDFFARWPAESRMPHVLRWGLWPIGDTPEPLEAFAPMLERMARRGWNPRASASWLLTNADVRIFGADSAPHEWVFRRCDAGAFIAEVAVDSAPGSLFINPLNGQIRDGRQAWRLRLTPDETVVWSVVPMAHIAEEKRFLTTLADTWPIARYALQNVESWEREQALGCVANVDEPHPIGRWGRQRLTLTVKNTGTEPLKCSGMRVIGRLVWASEAVGELLPGAETNWVCEFDGDGVPSDGTIELQWELTGKNREPLLCWRRWRARMADAVEVTREHANLLPHGDDTLVAQLDLHNHTDEEQKLMLRWRGNSGSGRRAVTLSPRESRRVAVQVPRKGMSFGEVFVRVEQRDQLLARFRYEFASGPDIGKKDD